MAVRYPCMLRQAHHRLLTGIPHIKLAAPKEGAKRQILSLKPAHGIGTGCRSLKGSPPDNDPRRRVRRLVDLGPDKPEVDRELERVEDELQGWVAELAEVIFSGKRSPTRTGWTAERPWKRRCPPWATETWVRSSTPSTGTVPLPATCNGVLPNLFFNPHSEIILQGHYGPDRVFQADTILVKCPSNTVRYRMKHRPTAAETPES